MIDLDKIQVAEIRKNLFCLFDLTIIKYYQDSLLLGEFQCNLSLQLLG